MKTNANTVRVGNVIEHQGKLWRVAKTQHTMPGKGGAFIQMELKDIMVGTKLNERFRSSEDVEVARVESQEYQYLYGDDDTLTLMDPESFEQIQVDTELLGDQTVFLQDGMSLSVESHETGVVGVALPEQMVFEIADTEPVVKGQTAASSNKPAELDNGVRIMVPPFINVGDRVVINTQTQEYVERAKD